MILTEIGSGESNRFSSMRAVRNQERDISPQDAAVNRKSFGNVDQTGSFAAHRGSNTSNPMVQPGVSLAFVSNPSVAELSQLTALTMVRNFQELSRIDDVVRTTRESLIIHLKIVPNFC